MSSRAKQVGISRKKGKVEAKGLILKSGSRIFIIIDGVKYFVSIKALEDILKGAKKKTSLLGY